MRVNEIFESIQAEGKYSGYPALFIRLSGCNRKCKFCDTSYHTNGKEMSIDDVVNKINKSDKEIIVWTGGEVLIQQEEVFKVIKGVKGKVHHLETNGDFNINFEKYFSYVSFSPKDLDAVKWVYEMLAIENWQICLYDIKIVTDLKLNKELISYATMLMPLTTYDERKDKKIEQKVWDYCVKHNIRFCSRIQVQIWGANRGK